MSLHGLVGITIGVPNVEQAAAYYQEFGLERIPLAVAGQAAFATVDGGEQLRLVQSNRRRLVELRIGADDPDDLDRIEHSLDELGEAAHRDQRAITTVEAATGVSVVVAIAPRIRQAPAEAVAYNGPGSVSRPNERSAAILREGPVKPRRLGHVVLGSVDQERSQRFFRDGLGFKLSDTVPGLAAFLRCSPDHHNVLVQQAPVPFLHHSAWEVDDVDEVGRGATRMLEADPSRHVWGLGRHHVGSNFFWYLRDPAGNFTEYYSDLDCIVDDALWRPEVWEGARGLFNWGPPPPPSFLEPEDLADLMLQSH